MTTTGFAHDTGLLPVEPTAEASPIRPTTLENDRFPNGQPSLCKQAASPPQKSSNAMWLASSKCRRGLRQKVTITPRNVLPGWDS